MSELRLKLKLGPLEVEFEGPEEFASGALLNIMERLAALDVPDVVGVGSNLPVPAAVRPGQESSGDSGARLSTTDYAVKFASKSGSDLVMAAAAALHFSQGKEDFRRSDLLNEMKAAKAFYKTSYGSNLSKSLEMLVKSGRLQNPRSDSYALPYREIEFMRQ